jgi:hypothetical protein
VAWANVNAFMKPNSNVRLEKYDPATEIDWRGEMPAPVSYWGSGREFTVYPLSGDVEPLLRVNMAAIRTGGGFWRIMSSRCQRSSGAADPCGGRAPSSSAC